MTNDQFRMRAGRAIVALLVVTALAIAGCGKDAKTSQPEAKTSDEEKPAKLPEFYAHLLPEDAVGYVRISNVKRIINGFVDPKHLIDADAIRMRAYGVLMEKLQTLIGPGNALGISGRTLFSFIGDLKSIHIGIVPADDGQGPPETVVVVQMHGRAGLELVHRDLKPKLATRKFGEDEIHVIQMPGKSRRAFAYLNPTTAVFANLPVLEATLKRKAESDGPTLAKRKEFRRTAKELANEREIFAYLSADAVRPATPPSPPLGKGGNTGRPFAMVSHLGSSIGLDGGLTLRAYAKEGKQFPKFLVRTPREKKFLSRIPAQAAFLISQGVNDGKETRRNFVEWLLTELGQKEKGKTIVAEQWRKLAKAYADDPKRIENEVFSIVEDIWVGIGAVKSESALFVAPDSAGRWGAAFLFDVKDQQRVRAMTKKVFAAGKRAKLPWKQTSHEGLKIHYIDFAQAAKAAGSPVPPEVAKNAQLQIGYASGKDVFYAGTVEAIKFAHKPTGKTLAEVIDFSNVDQKNAIMISILPGRVLHRTFGVPQVDDVLTRLAAQIPKNSNYTVTLNFEPNELTFRTNIPLISLGAWAAVEFMEQRR